MRGVHAIGRNHGARLVEPLGKGGFFRRAGRAATQVLPFAGHAARKGVGRDLVLVMGLGVLQEAAEVLLDVAAVVLPSGNVSEVAKAVGPVVRLDPPGRRVQIDHAHDLRARVPGENVVDLPVDRIEVIAIGSDPVWRVNGCKVFPRSRSC